MKKIFITFCAVCMGSIFLSAGIFGCSGISASKVGTVSDTTAAASGADPSETAAAEGVLQDAYHVGDSLTYDGVKIVYMSSGVDYDYSEYFPPEDGYQYIFLQFSFENYSDSDSSVSFYDFSCYADGYEMEMYYNNDNSLSATMSAGRSTSGCVEFEVPVDAQNIEIEYELNAFTDKKAIFLFEGENYSGYEPPVNDTASADAYAVGDIIETNSLRITYLSCENYVSDNEFMQPAEGCSYITLTFEVENIGSSDQFVSYFDFDCYADGAACEQAYIRDDALSATLSAGRKAQGTVTFEVPDSAAVAEAECETNVWTDSRIIFKIR